MSSEEDKPPAPPVRLTSNRGGVGIERVPLPGCGAGDLPPVDMRPLPKGEYDDDDAVDKITVLHWYYWFTQSQTMRIGRRRHWRVRTKERNLRTWIPNQIYRIPLTLSTLSMWDSMQSLANLRWVLVGLLPYMPWDTSSYAYFLALQSFWFWVYEKLDP